MQPGAPTLVDLCTVLFIPLCADFEEFWKFLFLVPVQVLAMRKREQTNYRIQMEKWIDNMLNTISSHLYALMYMY